MAVVVVNNPFVVGKYLSDKYFCDRASETEFLRKQVNNEIFGGNAIICYLCSR